MTSHVGNCGCACGLEYRFEIRAGSAVFWPRCGAHAFRPVPLAQARCLRCGAELTKLLPAAAPAAA